MIATLRGEVAHIGLDSLVLEVQGVGYLVFATPATLADVRLGQEALLSTTLVVREDSLTIFGFLSSDERDMYEALQTVSGVGPKLALAMLAVHSPDELRRAVESEDLPALQKVPGVGPKSAKRLVLELHGKLGAVIKPSVTDTRPTPPTGTRDDVIKALVGLGWSEKVAEKGVAETVASSSQELESSQLLRATLLVLGGKKHG